MLTDMNENWKEIPDWPGYWVSDKGRVYSQVSGKFLTGRKGKWGHTQVQLGARPGLKATIGRLMLLAFRPHPDSGNLHAAHNDGNPTNDTLENLRWATCAENFADRHLHGTDNRGERNPKAKLTAEAVRVIRRCIERGIKKVTLARMFGVSGNTICWIGNRKIWSHV